MVSIGEALCAGRTVEELMQKALQNEGLDIETYYLRISLASNPF